VGVHKVCRVDLGDISSDDVAHRLRLGKGTRPPPLVWNRLHVVRHVEQQGHPSLCKDVRGPMPGTALHHPGRRHLLEKKVCIANRTTHQNPRGEARGPFHALLHVHGRQQRYRTLLGDEGLLGALLRGVGLRRQEQRVAHLELRPELLHGHLVHGAEELQFLLLDLGGEPHLVTVGDPESQELRLVRGGVGDVAV
jgi:hypothetical protein